MFSIGLCSGRKANISSLYTVIMMGKEKEKSILSFKAKVAHLVSYFLSGPDEISPECKIFAQVYLHLRCLPVPYPTLCVPLQAQLSDLWSAIMSLNPLQFEPIETESHHLKIWYFQISCSFLGDHGAHSFRSSDPNFSEFLAGRFGFKAVEE